MNRALRLFRHVLDHGLAICGCMSRTKSEPP